MAKPEPSVTERVEVARECVYKGDLEVDDVIKALAEGRMTFEDALLRLLLIHKRDDELLWNELPDGDTALSKHLERLVKKHRHLKDGTVTVPL